MFEELKLMGNLNKSLRLPIYGRAGLWIPRWLGEIYSRLFLSFEAELFTFSQAKESLEMEEGKLSVAFSKLHSRRILTVFERSRPRVYRLLEPSDLSYWPPRRSRTLRVLDRRGICRSYSKVSDRPQRGSASGLLPSMVLLRGGPLPSIATSTSW